MPEVVSCPKCQRKSRVPDTLVGKKVKCPGCAEIFTAVVGATAPAAKKEADKRKQDEDNGEETYDVKRDRKGRSRDDDDEDFERVSDKPRSRRSRDDDDDDDDDRPRRSRRSRDDDDDDDDDRVSTRRRSRRDDDDDDDDDDDRPRRRRRPVVRADWGRVHRGLTFILIAVIGNILLVILMIILGALIVGVAFQGAAAGNAAGGVAGVGAGIIILGILGIVGTLGFTALKITGHFFCLPSPDAYGSRPLALTTLILALVVLACQILHWIILFATVGAAGMGAVGNPMAVGAASNALSTILSLIEWIAGVGFWFVFLFYLRSLALATGFTGLARSIIAFMITAVAGTVLYIAAFCIGLAILVAGAANAAAKANQGGGGNPFAGMAATGAMGIVCLGIGALLALGLFIWWLILLIQTRNAVGSRIGR